MARFSRCAHVLAALDVALLGVFVFGPLAMPQVTSSLSPPSTCIAQAPVYHAIGELQVIIFALLLPCMLLAALVSVEVPATGDDTLAGMHPLARRFLRGCMVLAILLSAVSVALGLRVYAYVLEARVTVFACLSLGFRVGFFVCYGIATVACSYVFGRFAWIVTFYE